MHKPNLTILVSMWGLKIKIIGQSSIACSFRIHNQNNLWSCAWMKVTSSLSNGPMCKMKKVAYPGGQTRPAGLTRSNVYLVTCIFICLGREDRPYFTGLHIQRAYTSLSTSSMKILLLSAFACMHFAWELQLDTQCVHLVYAFRTNCNQNAYMHEQSTKEFVVRIVAGST